MPPRQLFVVVERGPARLRMRLLPVRDGGERVAVANRGVGIVPLEVLGDGDDGALIDVYHVFRRLELRDAGSGEELLEPAFSAWADGLAERGIVLRLERRALYGAPLPRMDWGADVRGISLRPWDVELTALAAGLRTIVKLDRVPAELVDPLRDAATGRGLPVDVVAASGSVTLLVARDARELVEGRRLEELLLLPGAAPGAAAATREMGRLLGYPRCCVERFGRVVGQNDTTLAWALLPGAPHPPASPCIQWLQPGLWLLSHMPCRLDCGPSVALGARLLDAIEAEQPGFTARWRPLAARLQVVDERGIRLALAVDGGLEVGATVTAADVVAGVVCGPDADARARRLVGRTVRADSGGVVTAEGHWYAPYVADHRG